MKKAGAMEEEKTSKKLGLPLGLLAVVFTCLYPCVFLFSLNAGEARAADILPFFLLFLATALPGLVLLSLILGDTGRGAVMTCLGMLVVINFALVSDALETRFPWFYSRYQLLLLLAVFLALMILLIQRKPRLTALCGILALTFGVLTLMSLIQAAPKLLRSASMGEHRGGGRPMTETLSGEKRNVYYLLFDEYGGDENLEAYFGYDNSPFYEALEARGFSVSHTTRNTESLWTDTLVPNMLSLDYVATDDMPEKVRRAYLEEPLLSELFYRAGYQVNLVNHRAFLRIHGATELTQGQTEDNITELLFRRSLYSRLPWIKDRISLWIFRNYRDNYRGPLENAFQTLLSAPAQASDGPTLTVSYIQCPHAPFLYGPDGTVRDLQDGTGWYWRDETLYPGQLQYVNTRILETVDNIQRTDPEAVILLMSDHGARVPLHMVEQFGGPRFDAEQETPVMQSTLCCVFVPGMTVEIEGETCINAARKTLDAVFGTSLGSVTPKTGYILPEYYNAKPEDQREG